MIDSNTCIEGIICRNIDEVTSKMVTITTTAGASILQQLLMIKMQENSANSLTMGHNNNNQASGDGDGCSYMQPSQSRSGNTTLNHQAPPFIHGSSPMMMRLPPSPPPPPHMFRGADNNSGANNHLPPRFLSRPHAPMMPHPPPLAPHGIGSGNHPPPPGFMMMPPHPPTGMMPLPHSSESGGMRPQMQVMHPHLPQGMIMPHGMQQQQSRPIPFGRVMENLEGGANGNRNGAVPGPHHHHHQHQHQHQQEEDNNIDNNNHNDNNHNINHNALTPRRENVVNPRRVSFSPFVPAPTPTTYNTGPN